MQGNEAAQLEWTMPDPVPSAQSVSVLLATPIAYATPDATDRRRYAIASLLMGAVALTLGLLPTVFALNGWIIAATGLLALTLGGIAMHQAPWVGSFGRVSATLGMTTGLAAATLMLLPYI